MNYIKATFFIILLISMVGCANEFMGAKKIIYNGFLYVERWYLNPEYDKRDIPSGTAFYGAAAEKVKDRFTIKYYIDDGNKSNIEIPASDMWIIDHNGKSNYRQDDENLFFYVETDPNVYEKFLTGRAKAPLSISEGRMMPIVSCDDNGWCKVYPNSYSNELYVKQIILKEPLKQKSDNQNQQ